MFKNFLITILSALFLIGCGYTPMYSKNFNSDLNIKLIEFKGDREINKSLKYNLERYAKKNNNEEIKIYIESTYTKNASTKSLAGNITSYNVKAEVIFKIIYGDNEKSFKFSENSIINDQANQLDETIYEKNIKQNFAELFSNKLIIQLLKLE
tara:strand:- start:1405 stop:1863 length:459 start_codon:yes stop_codon:yes gene_type:complete